MADKNDKKMKAENITPEALEDNAERIQDLYLTLNVNIDKINMSMSEFLKLVPGSVIELEKMVDEPLDILVSNTKKIARGEVVTIGENLGIRIIETEK